MTSDTDSLFTSIAGPATLSQEIVDQIEATIKAKKLEPGDKLPPESELGRQFGVSRTVVREALQNLSAKDLIVIKKGSGAFVKAFTSTQAIDKMRQYFEMTYDEDMVAHIMSARKLIEPELAALAAVNRTEKDVVDLIGMLEAFETCSDDDYAKVGELDRKFHQKIAQATHNTVLPLIIEPVFQLLPNIQAAAFHTIREAKGNATENHRVVLNCIINGHAERARRAMEEHLIVAEREAKSLIKSK